MKDIEIKLYDHEVRAQTVRQPEEGELEIEAFGWDYKTGDTIEIDGELYELKVYDIIHTDASGRRGGNYKLADATPVLK